MKLFRTLCLSTLIILMPEISLAGIKKEATRQPETLRESHKLTTRDGLTHLAIIIVVNKGNCMKEKYKLWQKKPKKERDKLRKMFKNWVDKNLTPNERKKLERLFGSVRHSCEEHKKLKKYVDKLMKKYGKPK